MISKINWNTGTFATYDETVWQAKNLYQAERSENDGKQLCSGRGYSGCTDGVKRQIYWKGYVGLMYPSDYGYAVGGDSRISCLDKSVFLLYKIFLLQYS